MDGVPIAEIIQREVAPSVAAIFFPEEPELANALAKEAFENPANLLRLSLEMVRSIRIIADEADLKEAFDAVILTVKGNLGEHPLFAERADLSNNVYCRSASCAYQRVMAAILDCFAQNKVTIKVSVAEPIPLEQGEQGVA